MHKKAVVITGIAAAIVLGGATVAVAANSQATDDQPLSGTELQRASDAALAKTGGGTVLKAETDDGATAFEVDVMRPDGSKVEVNLDRSFQVSTAESQGQDDDSSLPALSAADRDMAGSAALARVGQGTVSEVERENEGGSAYEVEVRLNDGSQVEVQLGSDFQVLGQGAPERDDD
ncbi:MAG TPA: PepSY domain-containing protein [Arthrobacter sp.]|nr:PepSY domain-containing protein [Arthrobacter sp.]